MAVVQRRLSQTFLEFFRSKKAEGILLIAMTLLSLARIPEEEMAFCGEDWPVLADFMGMGNDLVARQEEERHRRSGWGF